MRYWRGVRPNKSMRHGIPFMLAAASMVLLVAFIGGCGGEQAPGSSSGDEVAEQDGTVQESGSTEKGSAKTESTKDSTVSIGEPVAVGSVRWTVTDAKQLDELASRMGVEEGSFVTVDLTLENNSNQDITLATPFLPLLDSEGRKFEPDIDANFMHVDPDRNMFIEPLEPGAAKDGLVIYAVEPDSSGFKLQVGQARFAPGETRYIDLGF